MSAAPTGHVKTVVHLLRHGEVENPGGVLYGRLPGYVLSSRGHEMAERASRWFAGRDVAHLVSSPLERAQQTAAPLAATTGLTPVLDERVIEAENRFEGRTFGIGDGSLRHPEVWPWLVNPFRPSWGEAYVDLASRMIAAARDARDAARGHEAVIVSHQLPIWICRRRSEGRRMWHDPRRRECSLASVTSLLFEGDRLVGTSYDEPAADLLPGANVTAGA